MYTKESVLATLRDGLATVIGTEPDSVVPEAKLREDLGFDSLDEVEAIMYVEEEFDIDITDEQAEQLETVGQLIDFIIANAEY